MVGGWLRAAPVLAFVLVLGAASGPARAEDAAAARAVVERFYDGLLAVMRDGRRLGFEGRYQTLEPLVTGVFNLPVMTRIAVGPRWREFESAEQSRLQDRFAAFSIANYASNFKSYDGERLEVTGTRDAPGGRIIVESRIVPGDGKPVEINYLLERFDGRLRIIDVFLSGTISELAARRSEFAAVLRRDGVSGLVALLEQRVREMRAG